MPPEGPENDARKDFNIAIAENQRVSLISMLHIKKDAGPENDARKDFNIAIAENQRVSLISMLHIKKDALVGGKLCFLSL